MLSLSHAPTPLTCSSSALASPALDGLPTASLPIIPPRPVSQRPKLSVNTEQPRILGKGASLRLETLSAVSPTVRNTFSNAYEQPATAPALARPAKPRLSVDSRLAPAVSSSAVSPPSSASTLESALTSASAESATVSLPYKQPHNLTSILANSPVRPTLPRKMATTRPMFPAEKHVSFRTPLEENITTVTYTLAHSDLQSSSSTLSSIVSVGSDAATDPATDGARQVLQPPLQRPSSAPSAGQDAPCPRAPRTGEKRDSSSSEDDSDSCPETPVAGRRKRTRDWRWTLGPLAGPSKPAPLGDDTTTTEHLTKAFSLPKTSA